MTRNRDAFSPGRHVFVWASVLAVALGFVCWNSVLRQRHVAQVSGSYGVTVDAPARDPQSATGYEHGRRSLILPDRSMDGYHWIMQTQAMVAAGEWRVRHAEYDGAPTGREVHWAGPFHWWLVFLAWIDRLWTGAPWGVAIEQAAVVSGPALLALLLVGVTPLLAGRFAPAAAALFALGAVSALPFYVDFQAGYPDHHGLVNACGLLGVLGLLVAACAGEGQDGEEYAKARRWVIASAVAAGLGLWISAATLVPVLLGLGLGGAAACWLGQENVWRKYPRLFRIWGVTGAAVSAGAYLIEYFPAHLGLRLEVNHPLYALAWFGGGEALCRLAGVLHGPTTGAKRRDIIAGLIALAAVAILPVTLWVTKSDTFVVADPFLWRLHRDYIAEFQSLPAYLKREGYGWAAFAPCCPLLLFGPAAWLAFRAKVSRASKSLLLLALLPALFILPLVWNQVRWWSLELALLVPVLAAGFRTLRRDPPGGRWSVGAATVAGALLLVPGAILAVRQAAGGTALEADDIRTLAERDAAHWLRQRAGNGQVVIAGSPTTTTGFVFHGGLHGVGTLYWENTAGLKTAAKLYAAPSEAEARAIVRRCGITHIVVVSWDGFEGVYARLARGLPATGPIPADAFIVRLLTAAVPPGWLRLIPFHLPRHPALDGQQLRIYEVTADQPPAESLVQAAGYYLEMGNQAAAAQLAPALAAQSGNPAALALLAEIELRRGDTPAFTQAVERMVWQLPEAKALPLDEHVRIAAVLAAARRFELAGAELNQCLGKITEDQLRRLSAETLTSLLSLSAAAGVQWPDPALRQLATGLVPPARRM